MLFISKNVQSPSEYKRSMAVASEVVESVDARTRRDPHKQHLQLYRTILLAKFYLIGENPITFTSISSDDQAIESGCVAARSTLT